ncbi:sugar phosphotransferase [Flavobacterium franklandianum]|uniref:Sugar phosphotransferase n=1 Tax=Flavobacterium franklandianum TaxID=2594430 RepID=A0A553CP54_9FLAO|nr:sugar phosphotransferase [Flavobacterium franklandianum]TRX22259.1 sugar phosphotransferase [Flavobacterium franklandianum]
MAGRIQSSIQKIVSNIKRDFGNLPKDTKIVNGLTVPKWLPANSGTDQAAVMMLGLYNVYQQNQDAKVLAIIEKLAEGILLMQQGNETSFPYGAFLSYENTWHAYGSDQAYALLKVGKALNKQNWITAAQKEVDHFYPYLIKEGFLESFEIQQTGSIISVIKKSSFAQISYGIRPMIWATIELYKITNNTKYLTQAAVILTWYLGNNPAKQKIYDKSTGVCFDGISSSTNVNKNSGAESTIEALWAFQLAEKYPDVLVEVKKYN